MFIPISALAILGLHWIDTVIVAGYVVGILAIGRYYAGRVHSGDDFFLGGRKLGKWFQFFLNFGNMADPSAAPATAASVYRQGIGGIWLLLITLFTTPYYWFMNVWFRRVRLTTMADLFEDRFGTKFLATLYAVVSVILGVVTIAFGNIIALKTLQPIMAKPPTAYVQSERQMVADYGEFKALRQLRQAEALDSAKVPRYEELKGLYDRGKLLPYVSYLDPMAFYTISSLLVAVFIMFGGLSAAAVVNAVQTMLMLFISFILIPFGVSRLGGLEGLHRAVPESMFQMFGAGMASEYTWHSVAALILLTVIGINAAVGNMNISGSAKDEMAARLGAVGGGFAKRFVMIGWGFCGLIAVGIFGSTLSDPDQAWGLLSRTLLPVGIMGMMIVGLLGGKLAALGASSIVLSALTVKNLYEPLFPGKSEAHYMRIARLTVPVMLAFGVLVALTMTSAISVIKFLITLGAVWGAPMLLIFLWRRLTETAVRMEVILCLVYMAVLPMAVSWTPALRQNPALTAMTMEKTVTAHVKATLEDVHAGFAAKAGEKIPKKFLVEPVAIYFEEGVARVNPEDPASPKEGLGRFNIEVYTLHLLGIHVRNFSPALLLTTRFMVDSLLPILLLLVISLATPRTDLSRVARFYARLKTPVGPTLEADDLAVQESYACPARFDHTKLFPTSDWEFTKWDRMDTLGFLACCGGVVVVLLVLGAVLTMGS
jgi:Na+/proline symporter